MTLTNYLLGLGLVGFAGMLSSTAVAQTCKTDTDCLAGYTCKSETVKSVSTPRCAPDTTCTGTTTETTTTYSYCAPKACASDADCATGMICHSTTSEACTGGVAVDCVKGTECKDIAPTCTKVTTSVCAYKWELPCNTDTECGDGFTCQPHTYGVCSGSSGATGSTGVSGAGAATAVDMPVPAADPFVAPSGGTTSVPGAGGSVGVSSGGGAVTGSGGSASSSGGSIRIVPPTSTSVQTGTGTSTCTTYTQYPGSCQPKAKSCTTDADCPSMFLCKDSPSVTTSTTTTGGNTSSSGVATATTTTPVSTAPAMPVAPPTSTATETATTFVPPMMAKTCVSPLSGYGTGTVGIKDGTAVPTSGPSERTSVSTSTSTSQDTSTTGGTTGVTTTGNQGGATPPTNSAKSDDGGCQMGHGSSGAVWGLSLLGLAAFVSRRRRRN